MAPGGIYRNAEYGNNTLPEYVVVLAVLPGREVLLVQLGDQQGGRTKRPPENWGPPKSPTVGHRIGDASLPRQISHMEWVELGVPTIPMQEALVKQLVTAGEMVLEHALVQSKLCKLLHFACGAHTMLARQKLMVQDAHLALGCP